MTFVFAGLLGMNRPSQAKGKMIRCKLSSWRRLAGVQFTWGKC